MQSKISADDFIKREGVAIVNKHAQKTFYTLEILMTQMNMMYFFSRLKQHFDTKSPTIEQLKKLMVRCLKLYTMIGDFMNIFKLIDKLLMAGAFHDIFEPDSDSAFQMERLW